MFAHESLNVCGCNIEVVWMMKAFSKSFRLC